MEIEEIKKGFVERLRREMTKKGFDVDGRKMSAFAKAFKIPSATVHSWLQGRNLPNGEQLVILCEKLECSADYLLFGTENERRRAIRREEDRLIYDLLKILKIPKQELTLKVKLESLDDAKIKSEAQIDD
jgi:transcriptional regulator with XRE-family HTH domain